jgi:primosomal protein N' (replication factor Y)
VAGRAGRGDVPGKVIVQTYVPHHYSIQSAKDHDFLEFYQKEIVFRKELSMPPFTHLVKVVVSGVLEKEVLRQILYLRKILEMKIGVSHFQLMGPAPCLVSKHAGRYLWNLYLKGPSAEDTLALLSQALSEFKKTGVQLVADVDPQ